MDENEFLAKRFEEHRSHLRAVAYRMLGSLSEADDALQEAWLRLSRSDTSNVENLGGWLPGRRETAREPRAPPGAGIGPGSRRRSPPPARSRRCLPRRRARR